MHSSQGGVQKEEKRKDVSQQDVILQETILHSSALKAVYNSLLLS